MHYKITVEGHLHRSHWSRWFEGMDIVLTEDGNTTISGWVADQSALHGSLAKIRDLGSFAGLPRARIWQSAQSKGVRVAKRGNP
jgi:hypothetical protein